MLHFCKSSVLEVKENITSKVNKVKAILSKHSVSDVTVAESEQKSTTVLVSGITHRRLNSRPVFDVRQKCSCVDPVSKLDTNFIELPSIDLLDDAPMVKPLPVDWLDDVHIIEPLHIDCSDKNCLDNAHVVKPLSIDCFDNIHVINPLSIDCFDNIHVVDPLSIVRLDNVLVIRPTFSNLSLIEINIDTNSTVIHFIIPDHIFSRNISLHSNKLLLFAPKSIRWRYFCTPTSQFTRKTFFLTIWEKNVCTSMIYQNFTICTVTFSGRKLPPR